MNSGRGFKRVATLARNWKKNVVEKMKVRGESDWNVGDEKCGVMLMVTLLHESLD